VPRWPGPSLAKAPYGGHLGTFPRRKGHVQRPASEASSSSSNNFLRQFRRFFVPITAS